MWNHQSCIVLISRAVSSWPEPTQSRLNKVGRREGTPGTDLAKETLSLEHGILTVAFRPSQGIRSPPVAGSGLREARFLLPPAAGATCQAPAQGGL